MVTERKMTWIGLAVVWALFELEASSSSSLVAAFVVPTAVQQRRYDTKRRTFPLFVSIGLGPDPETESQTEEEVEEEVPEPDHELFRMSRLGDFDKKCDEWYASLLKSRHASSLGAVSEDAWRRIHTLPTLQRQAVVDPDDENWTPYQSVPLKGSSILPAYGLEQFGLPIPRRNAEAWRHFDLATLIATNYSLDPDDIGTTLVLHDDDHTRYRHILKAKGVWIEDDICTGRLVYIDGRFVPSLSKVTDVVQHVSSPDFQSSVVRDEIIQKMKHLPDGFSDRLEADVPSGESDYLTSFHSLSGPDHNVGQPTSQFAINGQQGTACFAALNSVKATGVALVDVPANSKLPLPILIINARTANGGVVKSSQFTNDHNNIDLGVACHPRSVLLAGENSNVTLVQSIVDLDDEITDHTTTRPKMSNGYTQIYVKTDANVTHAYLEESGGIVTSGVETTGGDSVEEEEDGTTTSLSPREMESKRPSLRDTHFETIDVQMIGNDAAYRGTLMVVGGSGRSRVAVSTTLLRPGSSVSLSGFSLSGGAQRTDIRTNIHHIAQDTFSRQSQKNMVGGRATTSFRGRIRVEQSAQQTDSKQIVRTILLSEKSRIWAIPSLEIIADDVTCTHGATVSDLSDEELFYLRSRGLSRTMARNILMYAFAEEVANTVDPVIRGNDDSDIGLKRRVIQRLQNLVPSGDPDIIQSEDT